MATVRLVNVVDRKITKSRPQKQKRRLPSLLSLMLVGILAIASYKVIRHYYISPQALLVLGGEPRREQFAAKFALQHPDLPIWVSSGSPKEYAEWVFHKAGVDPQRVHLDYRAVDTVTNFTTLIDQLNAHGIQSVYLITSDDHMQRAHLAGEIILGSHGIEIRPITFPSGRHPEPTSKVVRDVMRSLLWVATGDTGSSWAQPLQRR